MKNPTLLDSWACKTLLFCGFTAAATAATPFVSREDYHQVLPPTLSETVRASRNYLKMQPALSPWLPPGAMPTWREISAYREKKDELAKLADEERKTKKAADAGENAAPVSFGMHVDANLATPSIFSNPPEVKTEAKIKTPDVPDITVSPWLMIPTQAPEPMGMMPNGSGGAGAASSAPGPAWIRKPTMGGSSDIYIPFSFTPGYNPPTPASAVIYSQPDAKP